MRQYIQYENYKNIKDKYSHVSTWALWDDRIYNCKDDIQIRKDLIIASSKEEYNHKNLHQTLHGDVVVLGVNFSKPPLTKNAHPIVSIFHEYDGFENSKMRYQKMLEFMENNEDHSFFNMYLPAGKGNSSPGYAKDFMKSDVLHGAYMTDYVKFVNDNGNIIPAGIPESDSGNELVTSSLKDEIHAKGLKKELDLLGVRPKAFLLTSGSLNNRNVKEAIIQELGYKPQFELVYHYTQRYGLDRLKQPFGEKIQSAAEKIKQLL